MSGRNDCSQGQFFPSKDVIEFTVVPGVGDDALHTHTTGSLADQRLEFIDIGFRTTSRLKCENEMTGDIANHAQLRLTVVQHGFPWGILALATLYKIGTSTRRTQAGGIDRGIRHDRSSSHLSVNRFIQQTLSDATDEKSFGCLLQCCKMREEVQVNGAGQLRASFQVLRNASVIGLQKILQHQTGKQLVLSELLRDVFVTMSWKGLFGYLPS